VAVAQREEVDAAVGEGALHTRELDPSGIVAVGRECIDRPVCECDAYDPLRRLEPCTHLRDEVASGMFVRPGGAHHLDARSRGEWLAIAQHVDALGRRAAKGLCVEDAGPVQRVVVPGEQHHGKADVCHGLYRAHDGAAVDMIRLEDIAAYRDEAAVLVSRHGAEASDRLDARVGNAPPGFLAQVAPCHTKLPVSRMEKPDQSRSPPDARFERQG
jgi:hypothetical protein